MQPVTDKYLTYTSHLLQAISAADTSQLQINVFNSSKYSCCNYVFIVTDTTANYWQIHAALNPNLHHWETKG